MSKQNIFGTVEFTNETVDYLPQPFTPEMLISTIYTDDTPVPIKRMVLNTTTKSGKLIHIIVTPDRLSVEIEGQEV